MLLRRKSEGVHAQDHFRHFVGAEIAQAAGFRHFTRDGAQNGAAFVEFGVIGRDVIGALEARAMFKLHIGELGGDGKGLVHVAVRAGKDQLAALLGQIADQRDRRGIFSDVLDIDRLDLVAKRCVNRLAAFVMRPGPAIVANRAEEDEADLHFVGGMGGGAGQ